MGELVAVRCSPSSAGVVLRRLWDAGDAVLFLPPDAPESTTAAILRAQRPARILDVRDDGRDSMRRLEGPLPVDIDLALVVVTSGSTGIPKGVELTHTALRASTDASITRLGCRPGERWTLALPTHHVAGVQVLLRSWALGTDAEVTSRPEDLGSSDADHVSLVPTQLSRLLDRGVDLARFDTVLLGGAAAEQNLITRAREAGVHVVVSYGMSETSGGCVYDGLPLDGVELDVEEQRIRVRGPVLFSRYRGASGSPVLDDGGWFTTEDRGRLASDGRLEVLGRVDGVIVSGGSNVPVAAVEACLRTAVGVADVAVIGTRDAEWGEIVVAVVVPDDPAAPPTLEILRRHVRAVHPAEYAPRALVLTDVLPRGPMGELSRAELHQQLERS